MLSVTCPKCSRTMKAPENLAGKSAQCGKCGQKFIVDRPPVNDDVAFRPLEPPKAPRPSLAAMPVNTQASLTRSPAKKQSWLLILLGTFACASLLIAGLFAAMAFDSARRGRESAARAAEIERDANARIDKYKTESERAGALRERENQANTSVSTVEPALDGLRKDNEGLKASLKRTTAELNRLMEKRKKDFERRSVMGLAYVATKPAEDQERLARLLEQFRTTGKISWSEDQWVTELLGGPELRSLLWGKLAGMHNAAIDDFAAQKDTLPELAAELRKQEPTKLDPESFFGTE